MGRIVDIGGVIGFLMIALAPLWPAGAVEPETEDGPIQLWQVGLQWVAVLAAALMAIRLAAVNQTMDQFLTVLAGSIGVLLVCNQILTHRDSLDLLVKSRRAEAQLQARTTLLNQVILQALLGIGLTGVDMNIIDANPRLARLLHTKPVEMIGVPVSRFLPPEEMEKVVQTFQPLWQGAAVTIESHNRGPRGA